MARISLLIVVLLVLLLAPQAQVAYPVPAGAVFVSPAGNDSHAGTQTAPWQTLEKALSAVPPGGTIVLRAGTYTPQQKLLITRPLTIQRYAEESVTVSGGGTLKNLLEVYGTSDVALLGLTFADAVPDSASASGMVTVNQSQRVRVEGSTFTRSRATGLEVGDSADVIVRGSQFVQNGLAGMATWGQAQRLTIERNTFTRNNTGKHDMFNRAAGIKMVPAVASVFRGNTVEGNFSTGVWCDIGCNGVTIENNTVRDNAHYGIHYEISVHGTIRGNTVERNQAAGIYIAESSDVQVSGNTLRDNRRSIDVMEQAARPQQTRRVLVAWNSISQATTPEHLVGTYDLNGTVAAKEMATWRCNTYRGRFVWRWGQTWHYSPAAVGEEQCV